MYLRAVISGVLVTSLLSACGSLSLGDTATLEAQEAAVFACAKAEGDQIFPITTGITLASGTVASVRIEPTERVSPALASKINACAAASLADMQTNASSSPSDVAPAATGVNAAPTPAPTAVPNGSCRPGGGVLQGGSSYCVGAL